MINTKIYFVDHWHGHWIVDMLKKLYGLDILYIEMASICLDMFLYSRFHIALMWSSPDLANLIVELNLKKVGIKKRSCCRLSFLQQRYCDYERLSYNIHNYNSSR